MDAKTMKCDKVRLRLVDLADGALGGDEDEAVRQHLAACEECRTLLERLRVDAELLRQEPAPEVPAGLATRIMAEVRARKQRTGRWFGANLVLSRVAAVVLVAVGIWLGTLLGRGIAGSEPSLDQQLAACGMQVLNWEGM